MVHVFSDHSTMESEYVLGDNWGNPPEDHGEDWKHIPELHTCRHCDRIVITHRQLKHGLVTLPHSNPEVFQAKADGCPVFRMLPLSWDLIAPHHGPADLLKVFWLISDPNDVGYFDSLFGSTVKFSKASARNKAWSNKTTMLFWTTQFILDNLRRRHFRLFVSYQRLCLLYGNASIQCNGQLKVLEGMYVDNLSLANPTDTWPDLLRRRT